MGSRGPAGPPRKNGDDVSHLLVLLQHSPLNVVFMFDRKLEDTKLVINRLCYWLNIGVDGRLVLTSSPYNRASPANLDAPVSAELLALR